jgi:protein phosphatase
MKLSIPELALVVLIGSSGSGKSTFARQHFKPTEVLSSDFCRGLVVGDETALAATGDAFEVLHYIAAKRLKNARFTVIDATNVQPEARKPLVALAREYHVLPVAIVFNMPEKLCWERTQQRQDRDFGRRVIRRQSQQLRRSLKHLKREGFRYIYRFASPQEVEAVVIERQPLWNNLKHEHGPFDIIGDVHGCCDELEVLLAALGYEKAADAPDALVHYRHPEGRKAIFLGDLVDRGSRILDTYQLVRRMVEAGEALCVPGNHDQKLVRKLQGRNVQISHGLDRTLAELDALPDDTREQYSKEMADFFYSLIAHYVLDEGNLVVAHAGVKESMQGRGSAKVRDFALYGETTGETDAFGLPVRYNWAAEYRGQAMVVYGHTPVPEPEWFNQTVNIDTGCVFGGKLTALRYPEKEFVSIPARRTYVTPAKPFMVEEEHAQGLSVQQQYDDLLRIEDVTGKRLIQTRLRGNVTIREENSIAALEVMSRFAVNPKWLIYLPPTMSPSETSRDPNFLEHPAEAFDYYRKQGISRVICEQKHMGSRAVVIVCQDESAAQQCFGVTGEGIGICYTRTGRRFFQDHKLEAGFLERVRVAVEKAGWWDTFDTDWVCLDCELMPWSAKARELLRQQYAAVGASARSSLSEAIALLDKAVQSNPDSAPVLAHYRERQQAVEQYITAYGHYCWAVNGLNDLQLAPFHLLATEGTVHIHQDHVWHMETLGRFCQADESFLLATPCRLVELAEPESYQAGTDWWEELTATGGEGMVVKPLDFVARGRRGLVQPAIKSRGREYLRIVYGPEYSLPDNLERLRSRNLSLKRSLALREFALGIEALERFVRREPLYRVHESVFGVLALESEAVDPRL